MHGVDLSLGVQTSKLEITNAIEQVQCRHATVQISYSWALSVFGHGPHDFGGFRLLK